MVLRPFFISTLLPLLSGAMQLSIGFFVNSQVRWSRRRRNLCRGRAGVGGETSYPNRQTDVTRTFFTRVDVTEEFPCLVSKMAPYYDR
jgi:hypothetical protein